MNKGWRLSHGTYLQFLNAGDTLAVSDCRSSVAGDAEQAGWPDWVVARARHLHGGERPPSLIANVPHRIWPHALGRQPHCHQACWFSRTLTESLDGYSEAFDFAGDFDFILRAGQRGRPLEIDRTLVEYEGGGLSADRHREIPGLQHRVRVARLGWRRSLTLAGVGYVSWRWLRLKVARRVASHRTSRGCQVGAQRPVTPDNAAGSRRPKAEHPLESTYAPINQ